jgi:RND family efflux transporter MFP subunit
VPDDGVITEVNVEQGDHVSSASGPLFELLDLRYLVAEVGVPESHLGDIQLQDRADVLMAGSVEPVPGLVVGMNDKVDPESRSYRVRVAIDNAGGRFKAGQFVQVVLSLGGRSQATLVPTTAITFQEGQPGVFVVENERARRRLVTVGMSDDISSEILSGLVAGEVVVVDDPALLSDGMRVDAASLPADAGADGT